MSPSPAGAKESATSPTPAVSTNPQSLSGPRRWLFRGLLAGGLPLLLLILLEASLRLAGYGHPTSFFLRKQIHGVDTLVENPWFGLRFFPPALARSPSPISIPARKPAGVYRIFLFGESAALGDPRPAYGVGRYLETLLRDRYPGLDFHVVCVAMTAINSHAILPIARECARYQGDLWIVYMGNNEFAGPFGANTVFGAQAPPVWAVRAYLALERFRLGQWLVHITRALHLGRTTPASWGGLKMFMDHQLPPGDPRRERVYRNFQRNLEDLVQTAEHARVPLILSSVASNLKDCPPFGSYPPENPAAQPAAGQITGGGANDVRLYTKALETNPYSAEIHFRLGECFLAATNFSAARQSFAQARDLDTLPFRADTRLNELIAGVAQRERSRGVLAVDAEQALAPLSRSGIPGSEAFYEHVHLNWNGNYRLALAFARQAAQCLPAAVTNHSTADWASPQSCAAQLGLTDWNRYTILEEILRRLGEPPFTGQLNHQAQLNQLTNELRELRLHMGPAAVDQARRVYVTALQQRPHDHWLHHNFAEFLSNLGDLPAATEQMRAVCDLLPDNHAGFFQLGRLLARQQQYAEAQRCLETSLRLHPDVFDVRLELGQVLAAQGKLDAALNQYALARRDYGEDNARVRLLEASVFGRQHKPAEAIASLRAATRLQPNDWQAHQLLGINLALGEQYPAAQAQFEEVVRLRPDYAEAYLNLGLVLARQKHFAQALADFEATLRLDPQNQRAREFVATIRQMEGQKAAP